MLVAIMVVAMAGCVDGDEVQPDDGVCVAGLIEAEDASGAPWSEIKSECESVSARTAERGCVVVCNLRGYGLVCDADGCERSVRY
jgi:hypothetical protein